MIEIKCSTKDTLNLSEITEFQGNLKERDNTDYEKIERSIRKHGFSFPFFIWKHDGVNHCLDGHGRLETLQRMVAGGERFLLYLLFTLTARTRQTQRKCF